MKSSSTKEQSESKKKYVFFSDPDVIVKRAETAAAFAHLAQPFQVPQSQEKGPDLAVHFDLKNLENLLPCHPVQPYPFTFISAVKRKLALGDYSDARKKVYETSNNLQAGSDATILNRCHKNLCQTAHKMEFVKPLKVPDLKISPKSFDYARENLTSKDALAIKFDVPSKDFAQDRCDKTPKSSERVQRKLDFSASDGPSVISCENIEPLRAPNVSIASNLSKKKEHTRDGSREKENRSKRIKKDDVAGSKSDEILHDLLKRSKSPKHASRKDPGDPGAPPKTKNDYLQIHVPRESDFISTKPKTKNFATSTVRKDTDKRYRGFNAQSSKSRDSGSESRSRMGSNESLSERSAKLSDKFAEHKHKDDFQLSLKQMEDKYKSALESRQAKQYKGSSQSQGKSGGCKDQTKRALEKLKASSIKSDGKQYATSSETSENVESQSDSHFGFKNRSASSMASLGQTKSKDTDSYVQNTQSATSGKCNKFAEDSRYSDNSMPHSSIANAKKAEESYSQTDTSAKVDTNNDSSNMNGSSISEELLDPRKISFRDDSHGPQAEFHDLVTPDMNLIFKSKKKKQQQQQISQSNDSESDARCPPYKPSAKTESEQQTVQLMHPTALHMQFQAELQLFDSFNESLRQVMDVENCLYNAKHEQGQETAQKQDQTAASNDKGQIVAQDSTERMEERFVADVRATETSEKTYAAQQYYLAERKKAEELESNARKPGKGAVKVAEVQTQTVNDIATQTEPPRSTGRFDGSDVFSEARGGVAYERGSLAELSLGSGDAFEDLEQIEDASLPSKMRTMSEISLHETTSSIKTETGTEISISTRDVTCSFNKYLDLEIAQLIQDEKQRYDKIEMLFKSREKTLNDRTKKLAKLEEQKRALRDTGQDSRISSVKKKQRALLLKLQQEKDEMNRLKELHKIASQERKLMLQKQRNMFNPQMSTKNILTKLKRSADSQSPRRLSGPMRGYDIRSNSSMSSLVDSDRSQHDRSQPDARLLASENDSQQLDRGEGFRGYQLADLGKALSRLDESDDAPENDASAGKDLAKARQEHKSKYETKSRKFEEKMPSTDALRLRSQQLDQLESKLLQGHSGGQGRADKQRSTDASEHVKSESDTLVEELSRKSKASDHHAREPVSSKERESASKSIATNTESVQEQISSSVARSSQVTEDAHASSRASRKTDKSSASDKDACKKSQHGSDAKTSAKRKGQKCQKAKSTSSVLTENIPRSKSSSQASEEFAKHHGKRTKVDKELVRSDASDATSILGQFELDESQGSVQALIKHSRAVKDRNAKLLGDVASECKENRSEQAYREDDELERFDSVSRNEERSGQNAGNVSTRSRVSTFAISHHSSADSEKSYTKSVVIRSQDHNFKTSKKLEQILSAREAALASRKNCVEEWIAWHARLRAEEDRVARMEHAAFKLVSATSNVLSQHERSVCTFVDTTNSSDTSDVEGRIELLTEKLAERRIEMSRLKREARKQAKQKLRALEANLLHQIKRYDTTIHEMRKKLESKKGIKDADKLAIESRSLADFKVPEIPLKRIHDIYKSSDLLRSRSESDLLSTKHQRDVAKSLRQIYADGGEMDASQKTLTRSAASSIARVDAQRNEPAQGARSGLEKSVSERIEREKLDPASMSSDDANFDKYTPYSASVCSDASRAKYSASSKRSAAPQDVQSEIRTVKSDDSDAKISKSESTIRSEIFESKTENSRSDKTRREDAKSPQSRTIESDSGMLAFSQKLDFLHLNNKNLNDDINSLENELKALSEMMSRFAKKSDAKVGSENDERNTSRDVSEVLSRSSVSEVNAESVKTDLGRIVDCKTSALDSVDVQLEDSRSESDAISAIIPDDASLFRLSQEIDYEAKSKEILNEIEQCLISENIKLHDSELNHTSLVLEESIHSLNKDNEELSNDLISLESDIKSISENISKVAETKKSSTIATSNAREATSVSQKTEANERSLVEDEKDSIVCKESISIGKLAELDCKPGEEDANSVRESLPRHTDVSEETDASDVEDVSLNFKDAEVSLKTFNETMVSLKTLNETEETVAGEAASASSYLDDKAPLDDAEASRDSSDGKDDSSDCSANETAAISIGKKSIDEDDWTISDSFDARPNKISPEKDEQSLRSFSDDRNLAERFGRNGDQEIDRNISDLEDNSMFVPNGESTNIEVTKFDVTITASPGRKSDELDDILDIIARESERGEDDVKIQEKEVEKEEEEEASPRSVVEASDKSESIQSSVANKIEKDVDTLVEKEEAGEEERPSSEVETKISSVLADEEGSKLATELATSTVSVKLRVLVDDETIAQRSESREILITELAPESIEEQSLPELVIDAKVELADEDADEPVSRNEKISEDLQKTFLKSDIEIRECLAPIVEQDSSDGEQLDNLVEVAESSLATIATPTKPVEEETSPPKEIETSLEANETREAERDEKVGPRVQRSFDILKDPEYEDISEESLEVSEILDKTEAPRSAAQRPVPEKYRLMQKSDEVLRILDEISQRSLAVEQPIRPFNDNGPESVVDARDEKAARSDDESKASKEGSKVESKEETKVESKESESMEEEARIRKADVESEKENEKRDSSESSDGGDTPRGVSEIELDSPRDPNESRLDIENLDDDLLSDDKTGKSAEAKAEFHAAPIAASSEKDIEAMIDRLKASLEQPGLEVSELEAKLLRIEQLQIELQIKKLEAEEVSYYVREIPNKPPPPYTPPGDGRLLATLSSPSPPPAVIPSNVDELTAFTEKATALIFKAKQAGEDVASLRAPPEIYEATREGGDASRKDPRIYNTFLFDLCKEMIAEVYRADYERPGPSWTRPNAKTRPAMKTPRTVEELNDYVSKEVATLFGFKTKLQRENMVMRWSRKRRDRVDELLAREAQAEEDEWTKFHHDELVVKNDLTLAILDKLIPETVSCVKVAYAKKSRLAT